MTQPIYRSDAGQQEVEAKYRRALAAWPVPYETRELETRFGKTFAVVCGPPDGQPLVLFQGSGANSALWVTDVEAWATRFRVYAIDMIGEPGLSEPVRPPLASEDHSLWLDDVLNALEITSACFVGVSLGGWLVLDHAVRRSNRVQKAVLICPSGVGRQRRSFFLKLLPLTLLGAWGRRRILRMLVGRPETPPPPPPAALLEMIASIRRHFRPRLVRVPIFSDESLRSLRMPVLLIVGGRDPLLDSGETRRRLEANAPSVVVHFLPTVGHLITGQRERIRDFLILPMR